MNLGIGVRPWAFLLVTAMFGASHLSQGAESPFAIRGTLPWHNFLSGPTAWNEDDYERYLDRLKSLGLNYVTFHCYTGGAERYATYVEPLIRIEYRNVVPATSLDTSLTARWGYRPLAIPEFAFGSDRLFPRPEGARAFGAQCAVLAKDNDDRYVRAQGLMRRVVEMAHARGIQVGLGFEFGIHPPEFASIVPPDSWIRGAQLPDPTHPASIEILRHTIDDILRAYPGIDWIWLWLHEHTMVIGRPYIGDRFREVLRKDMQFFSDAQNDEAMFTGIWSLAYIRLAQEYLAQRAPKVRLAISGWGGGAQLPGVLLGLDRALPKEIVFTCLNPNQGWAAQLPVLAEISKRRPVWAIPWLEGDACLWHLQPRVALLREQVRLAHLQRLPGVIAIHWRTEEMRANLEAFARFADSPPGAPSVEDFYLQDCEQQFGHEAATNLAPRLARFDQEQTLTAQSPEYYPYDPTWGRLKPELRARLSSDWEDIHRLSGRAQDARHRSNLEWLAANFRFTLLLDEVGQKLEPAYELKQNWLRGEVPAAQRPTALAAARQSLAAAPLEPLFQTYSQRVRSRGEMGVLSALNQKLWLTYRELQTFLESAEAQATPASRAGASGPK